MEAGPIEGPHSTEARVDMNNLPDDILIRVFSFLDAVELTWASAVCKRWYIASHSVDLWRDINLRQEVTILSTNSSNI